MPVKTPKELFVTLLSDARQSTERSAKLYHEISQAAQDPDIKEALESRAWISGKDLSTIKYPTSLVRYSPKRATRIIIDDFNAIEPYLVRSNSSTPTANTATPPARVGKR